MIAGTPSTTISASTASGWKPGSSVGHTWSKGWGSSAGGGPAAATAAAAAAASTCSSQRARSSRAARHPASAFSAEMRAASASSIRRSSLGNWARRSAPPVSTRRSDSRTVAFSRLISPSQLRAAASASSGPFAASLAARNAAWRRSLASATRRGSDRSWARSTCSRRMSYARCASRSASPARRASSLEASASAHRSPTRRRSSAHAPSARAAPPVPVPAASPGPARPGSAAPDVAAGMSPGPTAAATGRSASAVPAGVVPRPTAARIAADRTAGARARPLPWSRGSGSWTVVVIGMATAVAGIVVGTGAVGIRTGWIPANAVIGAVAAVAGTSSPPCPGTPAHAASLGEPRAGPSARMPLGVASVDGRRVEIEFGAMVSRTS